MKVWALELWLEKRENLGKVQVFQRHKVVLTVSHL